MTVRDIFGNIHDNYRVINDKYEHVVIIEDLDTHQNWTVHKRDFGVAEKPKKRQYSLPENRFKLKESQKLHYSYSDVLEHGIMTFSNGK